VDANGPPFPTTIPSLKLLKAGSVRDAVIKILQDATTINIGDWQDTDGQPDSLTAEWIGSLTVTGLRDNPRTLQNEALPGDLEADLRFTGQDARGNSIGTLYVAGTIRGQYDQAGTLQTPRKIVSPGNINTLTAGAIKGADFYVGTNELVGRHAENNWDFASTTARINTIRIQGIRGVQDRFFFDSNFSAASFGTISLLNADFDVGERGIYARDKAVGREIAGVTYWDSQTGERWSWPPKGNALFAGPDDFIFIL
jgi:hypothetical protein